MFLNNISCDEDKDIANLFASHFEKAYSAIVSDSFPASNDVSSNSLGLNKIEIAIELVYAKLVGLDKNYKPGPDGIPQIFLKMCAEQLALPLQMLFQKSLVQSRFPTAWKKSDVIPIFKNGKREDIANYRPVSILSYIPKIFDSIVADIISFSVKTKIIDEQHGFYKGRSTASNLFVFTEYLNNNIEQGLEVDCVFTDMSKAFDKVCINLLISKLDKLGFGNSVLSWMHSYLTHRTQHVVINNVTSHAIYPNSGVPQGSHLGPVLFSIYINDVKSVIFNSKFLLYADDLKIYKTISSNDDQLKLQEDLYRLERWCKVNHLELNISKCKAIRFSKKSDYQLPNYVISEVNLKSVKTFCDLGVTVDYQLNFNTHVNALLSKANRTLGIIKRRCAEFSNLRTVTVLYNAYVRPILEYCSVIWSPHFNIHIDRLEAVQRRFVKFVVRVTFGKI